MTIQEVSEEKTLLSSGKMKLIDGSEIALYPKKQTPSDEMAEEDEQQFFLDNVLFFIGHYDEILSDSRMFLAPVSMKGGMAYYDPDPLNHPTLGVYLEWWKYTYGAIIKDADDRLQFYWYLSGSPMSGGNACAVVDEHGVYKTLPSDNFTSLWRSFYKIKSHYNKYRKLGEAYSLRHVKELLCQYESEQTRSKEKAYCTALNWMVDSLKGNRDHWREMYYEQKRQFKNFRLSIHGERLKEIVADYRQREVLNDAKIAEIKEAMQQAKWRLRHKEIENIEYQRFITPQKKRIDDLNFRLKCNYYEELRRLFPNECVDIDDVLRWSKEEEKINMDTE